MTKFKLKAQPITKICILIYVATTCALTPILSYSESIENPKQYVTDFVSQNISHTENETIEVSITQLDENFKLPSCESDVKASFTKESAPAQSNAILLSCKTSPQWDMYIPISIRLFTDVLSTKRLISSGETITEADITWSKQDINRLNDGYFKDKSEVVGLRANHAMQAGTTISKKSLKQVAVVKRNQTINLMLKHGGIEIAMLGIAKSDGFMNDAIRVMNPTTKKIIDAVVTGPNKAEINY